MRWTTERPTEPGWYWVRWTVNTRSWRRPVIAKVDVVGKHPSYEIDGMHESKFYPTQEWSGPLPPPEEE